jgi:predicted nucleotidyltransferase
MSSPTTWADYRRAVDRHFAEQIADEQRAGAEARAAMQPRVRDAVARARAAGACGRAWLFGSFAYGVPHAESDVDVMVEGLREFPTDFAVRIGADLGDIHIHVVPFETASASLRARVLAEGVEL